MTISEQSTNDILWEISFDYPEEVRELKRRLVAPPQPISDEMRELEEAYQLLLSAYNKLKEATR